MNQSRGTSPREIRRNTADRLPQGRDSCALPVAKFAQRVHGVRFRTSAIISIHPFTTNQEELIGPVRDLGIHFVKDVKFHTLQPVFGLGKLRGESLHALHWVCNGASSKDTLVSELPEFELLSSLIWSLKYMDWGASGLKDPSWMGPNLLHFGVELPNHVPCLDLAIPS